MSSCQKLGCNEQGVLRILYTSEHTPDQHLGAFSCEEHEDELWQTFEEHEHYYPIDTEDM